MCRSTAFCSLLIFYVLIDLLYYILVNASIFQSNNTILPSIPSKGTQRKQCKIYNSAKTSVMDGRENGQDKEERNNDKRNT